MKKRLLVVKTNQRELGTVSAEIALRITRSYIVMIFHSTTKQGFLIHMYKNPIADCCRRGIERDADFGIVIY